MRIFEITDTEFKRDRKKTRRAIADLPKPHHRVYLGPAEPPGRLARQIIKDVLKGDRLYPVEKTK